MEPVSSFHHQKPKSMQIVPTMNCCIMGMYFCTKVEGTSLITHLGTFYYLTLNHLTDS